MNAKNEFVAAIDVAKGESMVSIISVYGEVILEPTKYKHTLSDLNAIDQIIKKEELVKKITVFMESTSSYHYGIERFFDEAGYEVIVVNPNLVKKSSTTFRRTKTDPKDCYKIAHAYFKEEIKSNCLKSRDIYDDLTALNRQYLSIEKSATALKNRYTRLLDICIPEHEIIHKNYKIKKFNIKYLNFFYEFPHSEIISNTRIDRLTNVLNSCFNRNYSSRMKIEATRIKEILKDSFPGVSKDSTECNNLKQTIRLLKQQLFELDILKDEMIKLAKEIKYFENINSIPGIGELTTAQLIAELKDINRFDNYKQINAYLGLEPSIYQSGKKCIYGKITKAGNRNGRKVLYTVVKNITLTSRKHYKDHPILLHYLKKKEKENKSEKESVISTTTKLIRIIFSLCKNNTTFIL